MTDIVGSRSILIQQESVDFQSAVSEAVLTTIGQLVNFNSQFQHNRRNFLVNGQVSLASTLTGVDGAFFLFKNVQIVGYAMSLGDTGTVGSTVIDVHLIDTDGVHQGSIFDTQPKVDNSAADDSAYITEFFAEDGTENVLAAPANHTPGVFANRSFSAGETLRFDVDTGATSSSDLTFTLIYRPVD